MFEYRVVSPATELPPGKYFFAVPEVSVDTGALCLFGLGESPFNCEYIVGRWYPDIAGHNWIRQPGRLLRIARDAVLWVIGRIVPVDTSGPDWTFRTSVFLQICAPLFEAGAILIPLLM